MSPSCRVKSSSSSAVSSSRARSAMRCTSFWLRVDTIPIILSQRHPMAFVQEPALAVEAARSDLTTECGNRGGPVVADRKVIQNERLDVGAFADVQRFLGRRVNRLASIGFVQERGVVD